MKITKRVLHRINLGNYEHVEVTAEATADTEIDFETPPSDEAIISYLGELIDAVTENDLKTARDLTAHEDSYIHDYPFPKKGSS